MKMFELPLLALGIGVALATVEGIRLPWALLPLAACVAAGALLPLSLPVSCLWAGLFISLGTLFVGSNVWVSRLVLPMSVPVGVFLGGLARFSGSNGPVAIFPYFLALLLIAAVMAFAREHYQAWFSIPRRIAGSWLVAVGIIILSVFLKPIDQSTTIPGVQLSPIHDANLPHIHGKNGEITYLSTGHGDPTVVTSKKPGIIEGIGGK